MMPLFAMVIFFLQDLSFAGSRDIERVPASVPSAGLDMRLEYKALIVGISEFSTTGEDLKKDDLGIPRLEYAAQDAELFRDTLIKRSAGAFSPKDVTLLLNEAATVEGVDAAMRKIIQNPPDVFILFISTHGYPGQDGKMYLVMHDTRRYSIEDTGLSEDTYVNWMDALSSSHVLVFVDACHAGSLEMRPKGGKSLGNFNIDGINESLLRAGQTRWMMASSVETQESYESAAACDGQGGGWFTCELVRAIEGAADLNHDRFITLGELAAVLPAQVYGATSTEHDPPQVIDTKGRYRPGVRLFVVSGETTEVVITSPPLGHIELRVTNGGTPVINGVRKQAMPDYGTASFDVRPGPVTIQFDGGSIEVVKVLPGETLVLDLAGGNPQGTAHLLATNQRGRPLVLPVSQDGQHLGYTPFSLERPAGPYFLHVGGEAQTAVVFPRQTNCMYIERASPAVSGRRIMAVGGSLMLLGGGAVALGWWQTVAADQAQQPRGPWPGVNTAGWSMVGTGLVLDGAGFVWSSRVRRDYADFAAGCPG
ncbi:MAG: caspase family protein [Alphaproteobacteria bacterium]|nr:caspase family protein [Alphaproteobacteria bacterium]